MADSKISALASGAPAQAGDEYVVARSGANYKLTLTNIAANMPATTISSGNLTFSGTGQRITGDFSSSNPVLFQSSTTDGGTSIGVIPNGAGTTTFVNLFGSSSANNCNRASIQLYNGQEMSLRSVGNGTFSHIPMTFHTGGSERMRISSGGAVLVGATATVGTKSSPMYLRGGGETWQLGPDTLGNFVVCDDADVGVFVYAGQTSWTSTSDERIKADLVPISDALNKVSTLRTMTGRFIKDAVGTSRSFLIAQDVQAVFPEAVDVPKKESDPLGLRYTDVIPLLVAAIKELSAKIAALEAK